MILDIYTKNFALSASVEMSASYVPRVGETITLAQDAGYLQGTDVLLVHDVNYILRDNVLTPHVACHASNGTINRRVILEENGWI